MTPGRAVYLLRRRLHLGLRHWYAERFVFERIFRWRSDPSRPLAPVPVKLLTSRYDWQMGLWMLASLEVSSGYRWQVQLHEDGSLGDLELDRYRQVFGEVTIVRRAEADARMASLLEPFPRCRGYRQRMPHGLKVFDIQLLAAEKRYLMVDPDVLFFRTPEYILQWATGPADRSCWFNQDFQEPSPIAPQAVRQRFGFALWPRVNSGLCLLDRSVVTDLAAMEAWLQAPELNEPSHQWRVEQTLLALSASRNGIGGLLPAAYEISPKRHASPAAVARHYVGCVRDRFLSEGVLRVAQLLSL